MEWWVERGMNKPYIFYEGVSWWCSYDGLCYGASTPKQAYEITLKRVALFKAVGREDEYALAA